MKKVISVFAVLFVSATYSALASALEWKDAKSVSIEECYKAGKTGIKFEDYSDKERSLRTATVFSVCSR